MKIDLLPRPRSIHRAEVQEMARAPFFREVAHAFGERISIFLQLPVQE